MGVTGTRRRQSLEAEPLQVTGAADIPWIGNDEASTLMQRAECTAFIGDSHDRNP
jgi:hypothetical protein